MSLQRIQSFNFLKSSRFLFQFLTLPDGILNTAVESYISDRVGRLVDNSIRTKTNDDLMKDVTFLCDSIEFPGQTVTGVDYKIPGTLKIKTPTAREYNEITASFLYPDEFPLYAMFDNWISRISQRNHRNYYFDDIVGSARIIQFLEGGVGAVGGTGRSAQIEDQVPHSMIRLINIYPTSFQSLQANWSDDGFHKMSVTFFFEQKTYFEYSQRKIVIQEQDKLKIPNLP